MLIINYLYFYEMRKVSRFGKLCKIAAYTKGLKTSAICLTLSGRLCKSGMVQFGSFSNETISTALLWH